MHRLTSVLGMPQHRFASLHVVGTNGKSSVALMTAALLEAQGVDTGAYLSPHLERWSERIRIRGEEIEAGAFASAVQRTAQATVTVNRTLEEGDAVTQFEVATAAAFVAFAAARVGSAVIEAGLGGRLDATNVIPSRVAVLTSVGRDHTQWLGDSEEQIAAEKLAVVRDQATLVLGRVGPSIEELARATAAERGARVIVAPPDPGPDVELRAAGPFQRRNFAVAVTAAEAFLGELDPEAVRRVGAALVVPGRLQLVDAEPLTLVDAAHNPQGAAALAEALPALARGRPVFACLALLADKDAEGVVAALGPAVEHVVCTELPERALEGSGRPGAVARPASELLAACRALGLSAEAIVQPLSAIAHTRRLAESSEGVALVTGSHYLLGALWTGRPAQSFSR